MNQGHAPLTTVRVGLSYCTSRSRFEQKVIFSFFGFKLFRF